MEEMNFLSDKDIEYIENMASVYGLTRDEAYKRFEDSNYGEHELFPEKLEAEFELDEINEEYDKIYGVAK